MEGLGSYGASAARPAAAGQPTVQQLPKHLRDDLEIQQLCDLYQSQLAELNACHSLLTVDQERLATMLAPYVNASGELVMEAPDPDVMLFKQGLDLRLKEFEEDCRRIQQPLTHNSPPDPFAAMPRLSFEALTTPAPKKLGGANSIISSGDAKKSEAEAAERESPPGQASYSLKSYEDLFPGFPPPAPDPGKAGFFEDAPPELVRAMQTYDGETSVLCGGSVNDSHITCGVHLFDDPKSGAPYVVPLPDTGRALKAMTPMEEEVGGADDEAAGAPDPLVQALGGTFLALFPPPWKQAQRCRAGSFLDVGQSARAGEVV